MVVITVTTKGEERTLGECASQVGDSCAQASTQ